MHETNIGILSFLRQMGIKHSKGRHVRVHIKTPAWVLKGELKKYEMELIKEDWVNLKKAAEMNLKQSMISVEQFQTLLELSTRKLAEFPVEDTEKTAEEIVKNLMDEANFTGD